jgi:glycine/D-amino acid oxidase-like deaminating enzyme
VKGEVLIVKLSGFPFVHNILHEGVFVLPLGDDTYKVGATYSWESLDEITTEKARDWLLEKLNKMWNGKVEILDQQAAVRPAVKDRKPLLGKAYGLDGAFVLNGMGSRATLMAPLLCEWLLDYSLEGVELPSEVNVDRFS